MNARPTGIEPKAPRLSEANIGGSPCRASAPLDNRVVVRSQGRVVGRAQVGWRRFLGTLALFVLGCSDPTASDTPGETEVGQSTSHASSTTTNTTGTSTGVTAPMTPTNTTPTAGSSPGNSASVPNSAPTTTPSGSEGPSSTTDNGAVSPVPSSASSEVIATATSESVGVSSSPVDSEPDEQTMGDEPVFLLGADISSVPEAMDSGATFVDTDGQTKSLLEVLGNHGFNAVRLRTFVAPKAEYGYAEGTGGSCSKPEAYNDAAHTAELGAAVKAAGMKLLVDFHYSDTWADPGKQIIPEAWRGATTIDQLAEHVRNYTTSVLQQLVQAGAKPDMVQVGNETTPGMLIHVPGPDTDCWGNNSVVRSGANGRASDDNWDNLATLLSAGADAVHALDPDIKVVLHIENTDDLAGVRWWVNSAVSRGVEFDVLGLSAYTAFQGQPSVWEDTLEAMAAEFPDLEFVIAEYNPERTQANRIVFNLPHRRGLGTFFWEPTLSGSWGDSMFTQSGNVYTARSTDFAEYDALRSQFGL